MAFLRNGDWVLVADGNKALFLENIGDTEYPNLSLRSEEVQDNPPTREQGTDRPGRQAESSSARRSAIEQTDFHRQAEERFAADLAREIGERVARGDFSRLVLVASPRVLGVIRSALDAEAAKAVVAEIGKTLTGHPVPEIEKIVTADLAG